MAELEDSFDVLVAREWVHMMKQVLYGGAFLSLDTVEPLLDMTHAQWIRAQRPPTNSISIYHATCNVIRALPLIMWVRNFMLETWAGIRKAEQSTHLYSIAARDSLAPVMVLLLETWVRYSEGCIMNYPKVGITLIGIRH